MKATIGTICSKIGSGATPRGGKENYAERGTALFRSQNVLDWSFSPSGLAHINDQQAAQLRSVSVYQGDVLLNITGDSVARACIAPESFLPARVNQHVAILRPDLSKTTPLFLLAFLQTKKQLLLQLASSGATRNALTKSTVSSIELDLPPIEKQARIATILSNIQQKITLNSRINDYLAA